MIMLPPNIYYSAVLMAAGVSCLVVAVVIWFMRREAAGGRTLTIFLLGLSWWDITYSIFWMDFPGPTPYFWLDVTLVGAFVVPTAFLVFTLEYSNLQRFLQRPIILALMIEPVLAFILQWTDPWHNLFFGGKRALNTTMILDAGPVSWANVYYSYLIILIAVLVLVSTFIRSKGVYRMHSALILTAVILPWIVHIAFMSTGALIPNADITPFIFSFTALMIAWGLIRYHLLDIVPIARSVLIENMSEGVIVLDGQNRVVDLNPVARSVLPADFSIGEPVEKAFARWSGFVSPFFDAETASAEVVIEDTYLDLRISPLRDNQKRMVGKLVVWRDITELKNSQLKLEKLATTDVLTLAYNRRHFMELAESHLRAARRYGHPLSLLLMDLDDFKNINDELGHQTGDAALAEFSKRIAEGIRDIDIFGRLGGEEFALLMPDTDIEKALQAAERLRLSVEKDMLTREGREFMLTSSFGLTGFEGGNDNLNAMLRRADHALYAAKRAGRNRVVAWNKGIEGNVAQPI